MRLERARKILKLASLTLLALVPYVAAEPKPEAKHTPFENLPSQIVYFEDTTVCLYHDSAKRVTYRSNDEGATWHLLEEIPPGESWMIVDHPFDNRVAFVLSKSKTHYRTLDRGKTWQSFETPVPPALSSQPLSFHAHQDRWNSILFTGQVCERLGLGWGGETCHETTYVTQDAFQKPPKKIMDNTSRCIFAYSSKEFQGQVPDNQVYCVAFEAPQKEDQDIPSRLKNLFSGVQSYRDSRLYSSSDFFDKDVQLINVDIGRDVRGFVGVGTVKKYIVAALKPGSLFSDPSRDLPSSDEMILFVTEDGAKWSRALFPHGHGLRENSYTVLESTPYSITVDVLTDPSSDSGTIFRSNSNGSYFVKSLEHTYRNSYGIVDYEKLENVEGVAIANILANWEDVSSNPGVAQKKVQTKITFDDGGSWTNLQPPEKDSDGKNIPCNPRDTESCSLHLHSVTKPHNVGRIFSSTAPGFVMGVGSIGEYLLPYEDCDTFLSTDAGLTWKMVRKNAHMYEYGDQGGVLVLVNDEEPTDDIHYSLDFGNTWHKYDFGKKLRVRLLTTIPDSTSLKFLLVGTLSRKDSDRDKGHNHEVVFIDFATLDRRQCGDKDFEDWYARKIGGEPDCLMGHKQYFRRRKPDASDCVVGNKFKDPVPKQVDCPCTDEDYECDYNYIPDNGICVLSGPELIPPGSCLNEGDKFMGSSGYRKIPGNTCDSSKGIKKDEHREKDCSEGQAAPGKVSHQRFDFPSLVIDHAYFKNSHTVLVVTKDNQVWQSNNEGFTWKQLFPEESIVTMIMHPYSDSRAYLITPSRTVRFTVDKGVSWHKLDAPLDPNILGIPLIDFHPDRHDWLIWTGSEDCTSLTSSNCKAVAYYTRDNGRYWDKIDSYVRTCSWGRDKKFKIDERSIYCESYDMKKGSQRNADSNTLSLWYGSDFYNKPKKLFDTIIGFATFEEYMVVAKLEKSKSLSLMLSLDGKNFAQARLLPGMRLENQAYTVLESVTDSVFLHVTMNSQAGSEWGNILKSNSNGTYYALSIEHVNRNENGFVDFEKMLGLDGIAVVNIVSNPDEAMISGSKKIQSRITHNDGGRWKPLVPPGKDSLGQPYDCRDTGCSLHIHGYTERTDPRATYSSPSAVGLMMAVGNVGHELVPYRDSDTFLTRDGGFSWEEVHKDAHLWEFGDQGSILVIANDEVPTDRISYSLDEGLTWGDYIFGDRIRINSIITVPDDTSRKFIVLGYPTSHQEQTVAVHLDFSQVTNVKCKLDVTDPNNDDFELWSPSEEREEQCLFGRQTLYHRRIRDRNCYVGERLPQPAKIEKNCMCTAEDFECEFNYRRNDRGECVLVEGAEPLKNEPDCAVGQEFWYERTNMRKIPHSSCEGGNRLDQGTKHACPIAQRHGVFWWMTVIATPFMFAGLFGFWWLRRRSAGRIRLGTAGGPADSALETVLESMAYVPWYVVGILQNVWARVREVRLPFVGAVFGRRRRGYRTLAVDDDAALLSESFDD